MATPQDLADTVHAVEALDRRILAVTADVRDHAAMSAAVSKGVAELGRLDFVLANAGIGSVGLEDPDPAGSFRDVIDTNLTGVWNTVRAALPVLVEQRQGGSVVLTSSTAGLKAVGGSTGGGEAYVASKHAVLGLMRSFATTYAPHNIRVNAVLPGIIETARMDDLGRGAAWQAFVDTRIPLGTAGTGMEIAYMCAFLCSDMGAWITGQEIAVDGGTTW
jgi:NAD(P)-dependent dehydrogenase (short-subunit alcohol dehydrogenase family)